MTKKSKSLLSTHKINPGAQVPLHVTNKMLRELSSKPKTEAEKIYDKMPLDEKIKAKKGKLSKPKRVV